MRHVPGTFFVALATILLLSGCATGSSTHDRHVTKRAYIARADAICARIERADTNISTDTPLPDVLRETNDRLSHGVSDLKALDRPAGHDRELDDWFKVLDQEVAAFSRMQRAADSGDRAGLLRLFTADDSLELRIQRAARRFGFDDCAR
jgi:hypothetical protein